MECELADITNAADLGLGAVKMFGELAASGALHQRRHTLASAAAAATVRVAP